MVPNPVPYYMAAQLQHLRGWENIETSDASTQTLRYYFRDSNLYEVLDSKGFLVHSTRYPTLYLMHKLWWKLKDMYDIMGCTSYTSIWNTPWLPKRSKLANFESWTTKSLRRVSHLLTADGDLKQFSQLQSEFALPHSQFFKYLQLRHAFTKENKDTVQYQKQFIPVDFIGNSDSSKGLISILYKYLLFRRMLQFPIDLKSKWEGDIGPIEPGIWDEILQAIPKISVSEHHRVLQIFLIH